MLLSNPSRVVARLAMDLIQTVDRAKIGGPDGLCAYYVQLVPAGKIALVIGSKWGPVKTYEFTEADAMRPGALVVAKQVADASIEVYCRAHSVQTAPAPVLSAPCSRALMGD